MVWSPFSVLGSGDRALNKVGKVAAPLELPFILVMKTDDGKLLDREDGYGLWSVLWRSQ